MEITDIIKEENRILQKSKLLTDNVMHYCPGCTHGVVHKLIAEVIEELNIQDQTVGVSPVGCSVFAYNYIDIDWAEAAHGRAPAVATAISRLHPEKYVFTYQGDGDLALSDVQKLCMPVTGVKISSWFHSTMPFMA